MSAPTSKLALSPTRLALVTGTLALLSFVLPFGTDMYLPAFPRMADELRTDASGVQLTLTTFMAGLAIGQLVLGPLSDRYGRRNFILVGTAVCGASTALCAVSVSLGWLVLFRLVMGFSGAAGIVVGRAVISDVASGRTAARLFGILNALGGLAPITAPLAGGAVIILAGWRGVFWTLAAACLVMFLATLLVVPETLPAQHRQGGGASGTLAALRAVLTNRGYLGYTLAFTFGTGALYCYIPASPFLFQRVLGFSVGTASVAFAAGALVATLSSAANAKLVDHVAPIRLLQIGLFTMVTSSVVLLLITAIGQLGPVLALPLLGTTFTGLGMIFGNATALAIEQVPHAAGTGSAILGTSQAALAAVLAPLMGLGGQYTAIPLFLGMTACTVLASAALLLSRNATPAAETEPAERETVEQVKHART